MLALPGVWLFGTLVSLFERVGADVLSTWLGALAAGGALGALALGFASRWPRHGVFWGLLLASPTLLAMALWLGVNLARANAALLFEIVGILVVLAVLAALGGRWGQRRRQRSQRLTLAKRPSGNALPAKANARPTPTPDPSSEQVASLLAKRPEALAIGATVRAWAPTVGFAHLAFNLVVLAILGLAIGVSVPFGEFAGMLTGFFLSAPLFLAFPFLLQGLSARLRPAVPRNTKGWDQGSGYYFLLGFAAVWLGIVGSMQAVEVGSLQRAEVVDGLRLAELPAYGGRNALLGVENVVPARVQVVRSHGWSTRVSGANRTTQISHHRVYVVPLTDRRRVALGTNAVTLDNACVWLGVGHEDSDPSAQPDSATAALATSVRRLHARRLMETQPRWLREVIWKAVTARDDTARYRRAIGGPSDAERGCRPVVFQTVAAPETLRAAAWRQLALYFGIANLVPLLLLLGYGFWRLDRLGRWAVDGRLSSDRPTGRD